MIAVEVCLHSVEGDQMQVVKVVVSEDKGAWIGYLQEYPDYWTQGETLDELKETSFRVLRWANIGQSQSRRSCRCVKRAKRPEGELA